MDAVCGNLTDQFFLFFLLVINLILINNIKINIVLLIILLIFDKNIYSIY